MITPSEINAKIPDDVLRLEDLANESIQNCSRLGIVERLPFARDYLLACTALRIAIQNGDIFSVCIAGMFLGKWNHIAKRQFRYDVKLKRPG